MLHRICYLCNTEIQRCEEILQCTRHCDLGQVKFSDTSRTPRKFSDTFSEFSTCWFRILNVLFFEFSPGFLQFSTCFFQISTCFFRILHTFYANSRYVLFQFSACIFPILDMLFSNSRLPFVHYGSPCSQERSIRTYSLLFLSSLCEQIPKLLIIIICFLHEVYLQLTEKLTIN